MKARRGKAGKTLSLRPPEGVPWVWMTSTMLGSTTYRALSISARRILDFLMHEHAEHAGRENGNLAAPYRQLEAWGVTADDVRKGFAELEAAGFVECTMRGLRQAGGGEPSRYALTWLPTLAGSTLEAPPSHAWARVLQRLGTAGIGSNAEVRAWLRERAGSNARGTAGKRKATPHLRVVSPLTCGARR